jgi:hypothetical protein
MDLSPAFACDCTNIYVASEHNVGICGYVQAREGRVDERYWLRLEVEEKESLAPTQTQAAAQARRWREISSPNVDDNSFLPSAQLIKHLFDGKSELFCRASEEARRERGKKWKSILLRFTCVGFNHTAELELGQERGERGERRRRKKWIQSVNKSNCLLKNIK